VSARRLPDVATPGVADARLLPDDNFSAAWDAVILPEGMKARILRAAVAGIQLRAKVALEALPLHGILLLTGEPGVGKTTVARGLADRLARALHLPTTPMPGTVARSKTLRPLPGGLTSMEHRSPGAWCATYKTPPCSFAETNPECLTCSIFCDARPARAQPSRQLQSFAADTPYR